MGMAHSAVIYARGEGTDKTRVVAHTQEEGWFRDIRHTTARSQIGFMELKQGEVLAGEIHKESDQYFIIQSGRGYARLKSFGDIERVELGPGVILMVDAGMWHEINAETEVTLVVIYAVPNHKEGTRHKTNPEAM